MSGKFCKNEKNGQKKKKIQNARSTRQQPVSKIRSQMSQDDEDARKFNYSRHNFKSLYKVFSFFLLFSFLYFFESTTFC